MSKLKAVLATAGLSAALGFAGSAAAQSDLSSWYIGGTLGQSDFKDGCQGLGGCDKKDTAWRVLGGYQFNRNFAAELGYHDLGKASAAGGDTKGNAWELVGLGALPLVDRLSAYGKLGVYRGELKAAAAKETNSDLTYGAGLQYDLTKAVGVRAEWQRYNNMGGGSLAKTDVDVLSAGVIYRFQ
jgi:OOP family OmpA-OmpF porin